MDALFGSIDKTMVISAAVGAGLSLSLIGIVGVKLMHSLAQLLIERYQSDTQVPHFIDKMSLRLTKHQIGLREATTKCQDAMMISSASEAQFLQQLLRLMNARKAIEVGVFTGYGTLCMAEALPENGKIVACDITDEYPSVGKPFWKQAGVIHKIDLRIGPAVDTLKGLIDNGEQNTYDFAFIDADKENYDQYYELCLELVRPGGVVAIDNVFMFGATITLEKAPLPIRKMAQGVIRLNDKLRVDDRVDITILNMADGVTLAFKK